jgi:hypothetical protein
LALCLHCWRQHHSWLQVRLGQSTFIARMSLYSGLQLWHWQSQQADSHQLQLLLWGQHLQRHHHATTCPWVMMNSFTYSFKSPPVTACERLELGM